MKIPIEISARHIHLSKQDFTKLFGKEELVEIKKLSQPGEFASDKKITIINEDREIESVRILGPFREKSQLEIAMTDAYALKLNPFPKIKVSGDIEDTIRVSIKGPKSTIKVPCIIAKRHLHCSKKEAKELNLKNNQKISIKTQGPRSLIFNEIVVRSSDDYSLSLHLDTDEGNSAGIMGETYGEII